MGQALKGQLVKGKESASMRLDNERNLIIQIFDIAIKLIFKNTHCFLKMTYKL